MLIFGSRAAKHWFPDFREPKGDIDYITKDKLQSSREKEYHWVDAFQYVLENNKSTQYVDPDFLYTIKVSHAAWDIHFDKTMLDIMFLQKKGCKLDYELYNMLLKEWEVIHGHKKVNLNKPNEYFFDDAVNRKHSHDELHQLLKYYDEPLHTKIRTDLSNAMPDYNKWCDLTPTDQFRCALEEIYVVATERYILPHNIPIKHAKQKALKQLITSMTKGWFNLFLIVNFEKLIYYNDESMNSKIRSIL